MNNNLVENNIIEHAIINYYRLIEENNKKPILNFDKIDNKDTYKVPEIKVNGVLTEYSIIGKIENNKFINGWFLEINKNQTFISKKLLDYGLNINNRLIKRILISNEIELINYYDKILILSILIYLSKRKYFGIKDDNIYVFPNNLKSFSNNII